MHLNEMFPSNFLKASDLGGRERTLKIASIEQDEVGGERKILAAFTGANKKLIVNKTNARTIAKAYGPDSKNWIGKPVVLFEAQVDFRGDLVPGIRIKIPAQPATSQQAEEASPFDVFDDEIPPL